MTKDQDIILAVREQDIEHLHKIIQKSKPGKSKLTIGHGHKKLNINYQDNDGMSALHQAALQGNTDIMKILLENGAVVDIRDDKGMRPLHYAAWQGKPNPVDLLLEWHSCTNEPANEGETPLHLACQHGHTDVVHMLLDHHADPTIINKDFKTALDLSCEFGRYRIAELLINSNLCTRLLQESRNDMLDNKRTTCLHLAAKNGHVDIIRLLLQAGVDINRQTLQGTALHEAALYGKIEVVKLLMDCGVDVNKANSYDQTALDIVNKFTTTRAAKELKTLLKEACIATQARAVQDYGNPYDTNSFYFREGDYIKVLEQCSDGRWRGSVMHDSCQMTRTGYFPASAVVLIERQALENRHSYPKSQAHPHNHVPEIVTQNHRSSYGSIGADESFPPPPSPLMSTRSTESPVQKSRSSPQYPVPGTFYSNPQMHHSPVRTPGTPENTLEPFRYSTDDARSRGSRDSPSNSSRHSAGSLDSGRGLGSSQFDNRSGHNGHFNVNAVINGSQQHLNGSHHRLSGQSYESGVSLRQSFHSTSSSSLGSLDRLEESGYSSTINVAELVQSGMNDSEIIQTWLRDLGYGEYYQNFIQAGYDMPTISRMTPEDLTAIGITKPRERKRLKAEIGKLNIHDGIPDYKPTNVYEWLRLLNLEQYYDTLSRQGYDNIDCVTDITWEDLEEIGIKKLGHQKKIMLAIASLKRIQSGAKRLSQQTAAPVERRASGELLEPPPTTMPRWSADMSHTAPAVPQYVTEMGYSTLRPRKLKSDLSAKDIYLSRNPASEIIHMRPPVSQMKYQPDLVPIHVRRPQGTAPSGTENTNVNYGSFHTPMDNVIDGDITPTNERGSTPDDTGDNYHLRRPAAAVSPRVVAKPKPVAKIVAKTKRSSREFVSDIIPVDKSGGISQYATLRKNSYTQKEHMCEADDSPPSLVKGRHGSPVLKPPLIISTALTTATTYNNSVISVASPTHQNQLKTKKPPPPPRRTNSIKGEQHPPVIMPFSKNMSSSNVDASNKQNSDGTEQTSNPPEAFSGCVKSLSARFQEERGKRPSPPKQEDYVPPENEEFPPPPPPISTDLEALKAHSQRTTASLNKVIEKLEEEQKKQHRERQTELSNQAKTNTVRQASPQKECSIKTVVETSQVSTGYPYKRNDSATSINSTDSYSSQSSIDSNTLPFANENVGTIKQRNGNSKQSVVSVNFETGSDDDDDDDIDFEETATMKRNPNKSQPLPAGVGYKEVKNNAKVQHASGDNSGDILDDIGSMLQGLTDELDAMLDTDLIME